MEYNEALKYCIFKYLSGSHAYGTATPTSDKDYRGVFIAPLSYAFNLFQTKQTSGDFKDNVKKAIRCIKDGFQEDAIKQLDAAMSDEGGDLSFGVATVKPPKDANLDAEIHELRKFFKLAAENNPNIIEYLWIEKGIEIETPVWKKIKAHRDLFLSKRVRFTFSGYAFSQLQKIESHRGYLLEGERTPPKRSDFGLEEQSKISAENQNAILSINTDWINPEMRKIVFAEKEYFKAKREYKAYSDWDRSRNPARKELEKKYMYDTKHGAHLVRLIRMAKEMLTTGEVHVHRPDAEELLAIRNGAWSYDEIVAFARSIDAELKSLYEKSSLPKEPNKKKIAELYREIIEEHYNIKLS